VGRGEEKQSSCPSLSLTRKYIKPFSVLWPKKVAEPKKKCQLWNEMSAFPNVLSGDVKVNIFLLKCILIIFAIAFKNARKGELLK
jgi:hypothetical protein